ncbi:MAG TPA: quinone oxidoreductase [Acidobacteriaceae bacterium]|nr:quinone oxidoreductase [Acidobacteriaceae bacterium]
MAMMKAVQVTEVGAPDALHYGDVNRPEPRADQVLVHVRAAGVNYVDVYYREGTYPATLPLTLGQEGAGVVVEVGDGVSGFQVGDNVAWCMYLGAYAEYAVVPQAHLVHVPSNISWEQAAAILLQGMTAHYLSSDTFPLERGDVALIHAGAGGVGLLLTQMAVQKGAHVITTVSTDEKAALSRSVGAQDVILYSHQDFEAEVKAITDGRGVDVVYDSVGKSTFEQSLRCLRPRGMMVLYGASSGAVPAVDPIHLSLMGSLFLTRPSLSHYTLTRRELDTRSRDVFDGLARGTLLLHMQHAYPLSQAANAHEELQARRTSGKIILLP